MSETTVTRKPRQRRQHQRSVGLMELRGSSSTIESPLRANSGVHAGSIEPFPDGSGRDSLPSAGPTAVRFCPVPGGHLITNVEGRSWC